MLFTGWKIYLNNTCGVGNDFIDVDFHATQWFDAAFYVSASCVCMGCIALSGSICIKRKKETQ